MSATNSTPVPLTAKQIARFWSRIAKQGPDDCWLWTGPCNEHGYGHFHIFRKGFRVHRLAWSLTHGAAPALLDVCHRCDERYPISDRTYRRCCNPAHLFLGTAKDNQQDAVAKGRKAKGERHGSRTHPERLARGDRNGSRLHPEKRKRGEEHPFCTLADNDVRAIRRARESGRTLTDIAREYGTSATHVSRICRRKCRRDVND